MTAVVLAAILAIFLLRWPLFGGVARGRIERELRTHLHATLEGGQFGGGLVSSVVGRNVRLRSADWEGEARRIRVRYGPLGTGALRMDIEGAELRIAAGDPAQPIHETVARALAALRGFEFPGRVRVRASAVVLADGRRIDVDRGEIEGNSWKARGRIEGWGETIAEAQFGADTRVVARTPEADVRFVLQEKSLRLEGHWDGNPFAWSGVVARAEDGVIRRVEGTLEVKEGQARTVLDLDRGVAELALDGVVPVERPIRGEVRVEGRIAGPLSGPMGQWTFENVRVRGTGLEYRTVRIDRLDGTLGPGTLESLPFHAEGTLGEDVVRGDGTLRAGNEVTARGQVRARVADTSRYQPWVRARLLYVEGNFDYQGGALALEGFAQSGELQVGDRRIASSVAASGAVRRTERGWEFERLRMVAEGDELEAEGAVSDAIDARVKFHGRLGWLPLPEALRPVALSGRARLAPGGGSFRGHVRAGAAEGDLNVAVERHADRWIARVEPTAVRANERTLSIGEPLGVEFDAQGLRVHPTALAIDAPAVTGRIEGALLREGAARRLTAWVRDTVVAGAAGGDLRVEGTIGEALDVAATWGETFTATVRGTPGDARLEASIPRLDGAAIRGLVGDVALEGSVAATFAVRGESVEGTVALKDLRVEGEGPVTVTLPAEYRDGVLAVAATSVETKYGVATVFGQVPGRLTLSVVVTNPAAHLGRVPEDLRAWIPTVPVSVSVALTGGTVHPSVELLAVWAEMPFALPEPVGPVHRLRLEATLGREEVRIDHLDGEIGLGAFHVEGTWKYAADGRPLELEVRGDELLVVDRLDARVRIDPRALVTWAEGRRMRIEGQVAVPLVLFYREFGAGAAGGSRVAAPGIRLPPAPEGGVTLPGFPALHDVDVDLRVRSTGEVRIENSTLGALVRVEARVRGSADRPVLSGQMTARRGEVRLASGVFVEITRGVLTIPEELGRVPRIDFEGRTGQGPGAISIVVTGPLEEPGLTLQSDPPRSQQEILAMLAFGRAPGALEGAGALGAVALRLYAQALDAWPSAEPKKDLFGRLDISTVMSGPAATTTVAPWELPPSGTAGGTLVRTEYFLNPYLSIVAESDLERSWSGDVKLRLRFK